MSERDPVYCLISTMSDEDEIHPSYQMTTQGFRMFPMATMKAFESSLRYKPTSEDIFVVTYPKCGTTWVLNIVAGIINGGPTFGNAVEFFTKTMFLELAGAEAVDAMRPPKIIKTHFPVQTTPWSPQAKYIVVIRNPKDCCVSFYHHTKTFPAYDFKNGKFDVFFKHFMEGTVDYGDYFDWVLDWYQRKKDDNVLLLTYEDIKEDTKDNILKISKFLGQKYYERLVNHEDALEEVLKRSSFQFMKTNLDRQVCEIASLTKDEVHSRPDLPLSLKLVFGADKPFFDKNTNYCRKGEVGDWKNLLSPEQSKMIDDRFAEKAKGTELYELWTDVL